MGVTLLIAATLAGVAGILLVITGVAPPDEVETTPKLPRQRPDDLGAKTVVGGTVFALIAVSTGWLLPAFVAGVAAGWMAGMVAARRSGGGDDLVKVEALATWTEQLRDVMLGGDQVVGAIAATTTTCPPELQAAVRALTARLGRQPADIVLRRFADDLDDPTADLIAAGLLVALNQGGQTERVLTALAEQARSHAERRRMIEAERAPTRREVVWVSAIMGIALLGLLLAARSKFLAPYGTATGQVVLSAMLLGYVGLLVWVQRLSRFPRPTRFLTLHGGQR